MKQALERFTSITIESRKSRELEISQLFRDGISDVYPYVEKHGYLFLQFRQSKAVVSAGPYVGRIPLTPSITVEVTPRLPISNLARLVDVAHGELVNLAHHQRSYLANPNTSLSVFEFIARDFAAATEQIMTNGFQKEYVRRNYAGPHLRGKLDVQMSIRKCWAAGRNHEVATSRFEHSPDIAINRVLLAACELMLRNAIESGLGGSDEFLKIAEFLRQIPAGIGRLIPSDVMTAENTIRLRRLPTFRQYYYKPLSIAAMALSNNSIALDTNGEDISMSTFLVNFETLFEKYTRRTLMSVKQNDFWILDGNKGGQKPLFEDRKNPPAQPDIVLKNKLTRKSLIAEVKYKEKPSRDDINQVIAYAVTYNTKHAILITQTNSNSKSGLNLIGTVNGIKISNYIFNLNADNLEEEEENFQKTIFDSAALLE